MACISSVIDVLKNKQSENNYVQISGAKEPRKWILHAGIQCIEGSWLWNTWDNEDNHLDDDEHLEDNHHQEDNH